MATNMFANLALLLPELYMLLFAVAALMIGVYRCKQTTNAFFTLIALFLICVVGLAFYKVYEPETLFNGMLIIDAFSQFGKIMLVFSVLMLAYISYPWLTQSGGKPFEFLVLVMLATIGMMLLVSANDLLALYVAIEMMSLALYVLASFNRDDGKSTEAGLKYFVLGALASGIMLYGISFIYGFTGTTSYPGLREHFANIGADGFGQINQITLVGMVLVIIGFCFKVSAVPFHMWTPDVYEGAPTPVTAFFAVAPKIAAMLAFTRLLFQPFEELIIYWQQLIIFAAIGSLLVGALAALVQTNMKRLLAYSSIGHVGFVLVALATGVHIGAQAIIIYLGIYMFMSVGMFGCLLMLRKNDAPVLAINDLKGLSTTHPVIAACIAVFMFAMAGIPPLSGFFGKMYIVLAAVGSNMAWLAIIAVVISVIACYYYIKIVKLMYFDESEGEVAVESSLAIRGAVGICVLVTLLFVLYPTPLVDYAQVATQALLP